MTINDFYRKCYMLNKKKIYFYGASVTGELVLKIFEKYEIFPEAFIDGDSKKHGKVFCGYKVLSVEDVPKDCYIILTLSYGYIGEVENKLKTKYFFDNVYSFPEILLAKTRIFPMEYKIENVEKYEKEYQEIKLSYDKIEPYYLWADRIGEMLYRLKIWEREQVTKNDKVYRILVPVFLNGGTDVSNGRLLKIIAKKINVVYLQNEELWSYIFSEYIQDIDMSKIDTYVMHWDNGFNNIVCPSDGMVYFSEVMYKKRGECDILFADEEEQEAIAKCKKNGISLEKEIVCIFSRDREYLESRSKVKDNRKRLEVSNTQIENYSLLINYVQQLDYQIIRVGAITEKKLEDERVVDITNEDYDELLDLYVNSKCRCWVGSESGACFIPQLFGKRAVYVNFTQIFNVYSIITYCIDSASLYIPKLYYSKKDNRYLSLVEMCKLNLLETEPDKYEEEYGVCMIENTPEDICEAYKESELKECGKWDYTKERKSLQKKYKEILDGICRQYPKAPKRLRGFDTRNCIHPLEIGTSFLEKHSFLLD